MPHALAAALGFCSGSVLYSALLPRWTKGVDVTAAAPDANPGAANAFLYAGPLLGVVCAACDVCKGFVPVLFALRALGCASPLFALVLAAPVAGHAFSPFAGGRGGKAIAVSFGCLLALLPYYSEVLWLAGLFLLFTLVLCVRPNQWRSVFAFGLLALLAACCEAVPGVRLGTFAICGVVVYRHAPRLLQTSFSVSLLGRRLFDVPGLSERRL